MDSCIHAFKMCQSMSKPQDFISLGVPSMAYKTHIHPSLKLQEVLKSFSIHEHILSHIFHIFHQLNIYREFENHTRSWHKSHKHTCSSLLNFQLQRVFENIFPQFQEPITHKLYDCPPKHTRVICLQNS